MREMLGAVMVMMGCYDQPPAQAPVTKDTGAAVLNVDLIDQAWALQLSSKEVRSPYEAMPGWMKFYSQDTAAAMRNFGSAVSSPEGLDVEAQGRARRGLARSHLTLAGVLNQAALASARSYIQAYSPGPRAATDPVEVDYLLGVSHGIEGDCARSAASLRDLQPGTEVQAAADAWLSWAESGACPGTPAPGERGVFPGAPPEVEPGLRPTVGPLPHYRLALQGDDGGVASLSDPTSLVLMAEWHIAAARAAAPEGESAVVDQLASVWRLPGRTAAASGEVNSSLGWYLFGMTLAGSDVGFLSEASDQGVASVEAWKGRSLMASILAPAVEAGRLSPMKVSQISSQFAEELKGRLETHEGALHKSHSDLAALARLAILRAAMVVNDATDPAFHRDAGLNGLSAYELSWAAGKDHLQYAPFQAQWVAWMAGNGDTKASAANHKLASEFEELDAARLALDVMNLRVQASNLSMGATQ